MAYELPARFAEYNEARQRGFLTVKKVKEDGGRVAGMGRFLLPHIRA